MIFYRLGENLIFCLVELYVTCAQTGSYNNPNRPRRIGPNPTNNQLSIFGGSGSFVIFGPAYHPKQEPTISSTTNNSIELCTVYKVLSMVLNTGYRMIILEYDFALVIFLVTTLNSIFVALSTLVLVLVDCSVLIDRSWSYGWYLHIMFTARLMEPVNDVLIT